jgi:outer membrane protein OmpA-like peptidoglycan-associated protein
MSPSLRVVLLCYLCAVPLYAQGPQIQQPKGIQQPRDKWQTPGEIQQPKGPWQTPGEIQKPGEIQSVREKCERRFVIGADTLFEFNQAALTPVAQKTLAQLGPLLAEAGKHPVTVAGHTDAMGSSDYNQRLSEQRAQTVKEWLTEHHLVPAAAVVKGYGKTKPVAPNARPDASDNAEGRQRNRRVEVVIDTCH